MAYTRKVTLVDYGREVENEIGTLEEIIEANSALRARYNSRWLAIKLLEEDGDIITRLERMVLSGNLLSAARKSIAHLREVYGDDVDTIIADRRYGWINGLVRETVHRTAVDRQTISDKIDKVVTNRVLGIPIFIALMWVVFKFTTDVAGPYLDWVDGVIGGPLTNWVVAILGLIGLGGSWVESLFVDGIIAGVGGVLVFVPV
ncbi:MAG: ferrous iron transport protein B, partial [Chloroflexi bacterium]